MAYKFNKNTKSRNSKKKKCKHSNKYSRKKIYGGTIINDVEELTILRQFSKTCANNTKVQQYIKETLNLFLHLLLAKSDDSFEIIKEKYSHRTILSSKDNDTGFVNIEDFETVLSDGNLREQMSMIQIFLEVYKDIVIKLIINKNSEEPEQLEHLQVNNNSILFNLIEKRVMAYFGFKDIEQLMNYYRICGMCGIDYTLMTVSESNIPSRYNGFPIGSTRNKEIDTLYELNSSILYPPLSCREKRYFWDRQIRFNQTLNPPVTIPDPIPEDSCPEINRLIKSGANYYSINVKSSFYELCKVYDHYIVSGPSGSVDLFFHIFGIFNNFNLDLFILSCIAYMGNTPDHSIFEILLPSITYGSNYDSTINEYVFVDGILRSLD